MLKEKKGFYTNFEQNSKLPIIFYLITAAVLSCVFMITALITSGFSFTLKGEFSSGDMNNDKIINASDSLYIIMHESKKTDFNGAQIDAGDVNSDGVIDKLDATLIIQYASETSKKLGVPAIGNTKMENPSNKETQSPDTQQSENNPEDNFVRSGNSYYTAFCTSESEIYTAATVANKWQKDGKYYYQINIVLKNNSGQYIGDSSLELEFSNSVTVEKSWSCYAENSDLGLNITTQCYSYVPSGGIIKCGIIVSSPSDIEMESVSK